MTDFDPLTADGLTVIVMAGRWCDCPPDQLHKNFCSVTPVWRQTIKDLQVVPQYELASLSIAGVRDRKIWT